MNKINYNIGLCGEYRLVVKDNTRVVNDTGWCKNTILSGGLEFLATNSILDSIKFLDLGTSSLSSNNYTLSGVLEPSINDKFLNIPSQNIEYYKLNTNTQVYYSKFSTLAASSEETINEFCIKTTNKLGFARAILTLPAVVRVNQNINFEYRVSVNHTSLQSDNAEFISHDNTSFYIPVTSKTFNIPNIDNNPNKVGRLVDDYTLILSENNDPLPEFGDIYPASQQSLVYGVGNSASLSRFKSSVVYSRLNEVTKEYTVITLYNNISAPNNSGIFKNINSAILEYDTFNFNITKFTFPLVLYNICSPCPAPTPTPAT